MWVFATVRRSLAVEKKRMGLPMEKDGGFEMVSSSLLM